MTALQRLNVTAVAIKGRGLLLEGKPGIGKSSLALALIDRGAVLIGDDGITVEMLDGSVLLAPPERYVGKLEVRGVGMIEMPTTSAPLSLILRLTDAAPRSPTVENSDVEGHEYPCLAFQIGDAISAQRAELALAQFGID